MLHEILLSLTGVSSPIWSQTANKLSFVDDVKNNISEPEQAILQDLAEISEIHADIKKAVSFIKTQSRSPICLAVASSIASKHLGAFRNKVLEVEKSILIKDAAYVGGYEIVPLSTIATEFAPWTRRLQWLRSVSRVIRAENAEQSSTGASLLEFLETARHTGYSDIAALAVDLLHVAQQIWMRSISSWVLYGQLPSFGQDDFMIKKSQVSSVAVQHILDPNLTPKFVTPLCAENILGIGNSLNQIRQQKQTNTNGVLADGSNQFLSNHLEILQRLVYPLHANQLEAVMQELNQSISCNALSQLLPIDRIHEIANMIQSYLLLGRGEFAVALITNVDQRLLQRERSQSSSKPTRKLGRLDSLNLKDAELSTILAKTWADLSALQSEMESEDRVFHTAKQLLRLNVFDKSHIPQGHELISTLAPSPTLLRLDIPIESPLNIFISHSDLAKYSHINAHLLSTRRAQIRLADTWKLTSHRRYHPAPVAPPISGTEYGQRAMLSRRRRENGRALHMRMHWSTLSKVLFFINELVAYLHGEVIQNSWKQFSRWLSSEQLSGPPSSKQDVPEGVVSSSLAIDSKPIVDLAQPLGKGNQFPVNTRDPKAIAQAHKVYLDMLYSALLIDEGDFNKGLSTLLTLIDHFVALLAQLQSVWQGLDLQEDDGIMDAFMDYAKDEREITEEMNRTRQAMEKTLKQVVESIKTAEQRRGVNNASIGIAKLGISTAADGGFVTWRARTLNRLIMKLDFLQGEEQNQNEDLIRGMQEDSD